MCGIAGVRRFDGLPVDPDLLATMGASLVHRGPDEQGQLVDGPFGVVHTRLSIIDLAGSHQPMVSPDGRWVLVFNGEIFNYRELRATLDHRFRTDGDSEVLLAGIARQGLRFVDRLRGQFAFAAHDRLSGTTHLVRDRLGVLPLHYSLDASQLVLASEVKALLPALPRGAAVDLPSLHTYLTGRSVPAPYTLFEGVRKVPPAHVLSVRADGSTHLERYWSPPPVATGRALDEREVVDRVEAAARDAVRSALVADVPVGAYLSGGVDSSLIVALMRAERPSGVVKTFSAGFGDPRHDELPYARQVAEHVGTEHHEVLVRPEDLVDLWPVLTHHRDAPVSEPADVAVHRLAALARQHVSVVLSGEGGDELFAGYPKYRMARAMHRARVVPAGARRAVAVLVEQQLGDRGTRARVALRAAGAATEADQLAAWFAPFTAAERAALLPGTSPRATGAVPQGADPVDRMLRHDLGGWLPDNLLERGDRMSMAHSLELRPPLLDHRLVELAFSLPSDVKVRRGTTKWALKEVARRHLPASVVDRRKVGFRVPLDTWFRTSLRDRTWDALTGSDSFVAEVFEPGPVRALLERHGSGRANEESRIWTLMSLEVWHRTFLRTAPLTTAGGPR